MYWGVEQDPAAKSGHQTNVEKAKIRDSNTAKPHCQTPQTPRIPNSAPNPDLSMFRDEKKPEVVIVRSFHKEIPKRRQLQAKVRDRCHCTYILFDE